MWSLLVLPHYHYGTMGSTLSPPSPLFVTTDWKTIVSILKHSLYKFQLLMNVPEMNTGKEGLGGKQQAQGITTASLSSGQRLPITNAGHDLSAPLHIFHLNY